MSNFRYIFMALPLVFAFNVNAQSAGVLEEVVVTAQKKEENLQDTPIAITAITESTIDDLDIANVMRKSAMLFMGKLGISCFFVDKKPERIKAGDRLRL